MPIDDDIPLRPAALAGIALAGALLLGLVGAESDGEASGDAVPEPATLTGSSGSVLLELFTSEGCSSCPPAERLFSEWVGDRARTTANVVGIAWHVDYWNRLGWTDPFSSPEWSRLQLEYSKRLPAGRLYTPQAVVQGRWHAVGSDRTAVERLVEKAAVRSGRLEVDAAASLARWSGLSGVPVELVVAVTRSDLRTDVPRGENRGRTLVHQRVGISLEVRDLLPDADSFELPSWSPGTPDERRVVFLRDDESAVLAVVEQEPGAPASTG